MSRDGHHRDERRGKRNAAEAGGFAGAPTMAYVIKRYANRKLYDVQVSRYVTLEDLEQLIRRGKEVSVVDAATGEDLTALVLTEIILRGERGGRAGLPAGFLHLLIKHGDAWQKFMAKG